MIKECIDESKIPNLTEWIKPSLCVVCIRMEPHCLL